MKFRKNSVRPGICAVQIAMIAAVATAVINPGALAANKAGVHTMAKQQHSREAGGRSWAQHVFRCSIRYRSYDKRTDTYMHYTGVRKKCRE